MKKILVFIASVWIASGSFAQGVTKHGESTTTGVEFVDEHGKIVGEPALDKHGRIIQPGIPELYELILTSNPAEGGMVSGQGEYPAGEQIIISATANDGWAFENWTGATEHLDNANSAEAIVTMPADDITLTAVFQEEHPLEIVTKEVTEISQFSALGGGIIVNQGSEDILYYGLAYSATNSLPDLDDNFIQETALDLDFDILMEELEANTFYYVRAYAITSEDIFFGQVESFTTLEDDENEFETITDIDGNEYRILQIGDQVWTIDNLKVTHFRDGTPIPNKTEDEYWEFGYYPHPAYCWFNNDYEEYGQVYGALYNYYAATHPLIAPEGWRVPTIEDFHELVAYLGEEDHGGELKEEGYEHWNWPNTAANNLTGFTALGAGWRTTENFVGLKNIAVFLTTSNMGIYFRSLVLMHDMKWAYTSYAFLFNRGASIRLIQDD